MTVDLSRERGATAVLTALLLTTLLGFVGFGVDLSATYAKKQELQNGADAAALAVAQDCAVDGCGDSQSIADSYAGANVRNDGIEGADVSFPSSNSVTVEASGFQPHWFMPVLGRDESLVVAGATAAWGAPASGPAMLPLAISACELDASFQPVLDVPQTITLPKKSDSDCTGTNGFDIPSGFAWMDTVGGKCESEASVGYDFPSDPGKPVDKKACSAEFFLDLVGETVLLPIYGEFEGTGGNGIYTVYGYVAMTLNGYFFENKYQYDAPCGPPEQCLNGTFVEYVTLDDAYEYGGGAPDLGAAVVQLTG
ncbi:pilus assembly protein TadG-related protein [Ornithinimicrobium sediminis]|uniref:pilus assembly protein TadG-related protein n=1 Tax=Ornithinimicrobium sediminis TaxID=2904603 RepID=UPI001E43C070|nr:pilus assembly protein TadG-related protein [Ornithinimicrobium sediminis]